MRREGVDAIIIRSDSSKCDSGSAEGRYLTHIGGNGEEGYVVFDLREDPMYTSWRPAHIENLMVKHPMVLKAAAFPIPDERLGERVCLAVVTRDGKAAAADQMLAHLDQHGLSKYDMPEFILPLE